jgi:hypothetical protein
MGDAASFVSIIVITVLGIVLAGIRTLEQLQRSRDELDAWNIAAKPWEGAGDEQRTDLQTHRCPLGRPPMQGSEKVAMWRSILRHIRLQIERGSRS